jgi:hypothetical protein
MRTRELVTRRLEILFGHDGVIWSVHPDGTRLARIPLDVATGEGERGSRRRSRVRPTLVKLARESFDAERWLPFCSLS